jgi:GDP-L-fucose synthase
MKVLLLGASGFVGKNVAEVLQQKQGVSLTSLSKRDGLDLTDLGQTRKYLLDIKPDIIINCAAEVGSLNYVTEKAAEIVDANLRMLLNVYLAVSESSARSMVMNPVANCAYPGNLDFYSEDKFWDGKIHQSVLSYGSTRRMMTVLSECYRIQHNIRSINFYVPNMYGAYDSPDPNKAHALNALIGKVVKAKHENKNQLEVWGSGKVIREWLYAKDFARVVTLTIDDISNPAYDEPFNIGQNYGLSIKELVDIIISQSGFNGEIIWNRSMPDGAPKKVMDDRKFREKFPDFKFTDFAEGIRSTIRYYESIYPY